MIKKYIRYLPVFVWMSFIFYLSSQSTTGIPIQGTNRFLLLKTFHLIEYAILAVLLNFSKYQPKNNFIIAYIYALTDEYHQTFVFGREGKFVDTIIDAFGITIGSLISIIIRRKSVIMK